MDDSSRTRASSGHLIGNAAKIAGKKRVVLFDRENDFWHGDERSLNLHSQRAGRGPSWAQFQKEAEDRPTLLRTAQELSAGADVGEKHSYETVKYTAEGFTLQE